MTEELQEKEELQSEDYTPEMQAADEKRAARMGYVPKEEFRGDPDKWISAREFIERAEKQLPIALGTIKNLEGKLERMEKKFAGMTDTLEKFNKHHKTALERETAKAAGEYKRGLEDARTEMRLAMEEGDSEKFDKASKRLDGLLENPPEKLEEAETKIDTKFADQPKFDPKIHNQWVEDNSWFIKEFKMNRFAVECGEFLKLTISDQKEQLKEITKMVKEEFPEYFGNPARRKPASVETGDSTASPSGRRKMTVNNLPSVARTMLDQFKRDIKGYKDEDYLAQYAGPWVNV
jgi:hypothetical protein